MDQTVLLTFMTIFGLISAVVYLFHITIFFNGGANGSLLKHSMGITNLIAAILSIFLSIELLTNGSLNNIFELHNILLVVLMAFYLANAIEYLYFLVFDWEGYVFNITKNQIGAFTIIAAALSLYLFFA